MTHLIVHSITAEPLRIDISPFLPEKITDQQFYDFCQKNSDLRIEQTGEGAVVIMPPAFSDEGNRSFNVLLEIGKWTKEDGTGIGFDASSMFTLPNGAKRSPDTSWIQLSRWNALSDQQKSSFAPICPDFVIELRSSSDTLSGLQDKMQEYIDNGVRLGLLIDRKNRTVHIYRPERPPKILENPTAVDCNPELPGFNLPMRKIW